jgi:hypothetical protein
MCGGFHKKDCPNPPQATTSNPTNHVSIIMPKGMMPIIVLHFTHNYDRANHKTLMLIKVKVLGKAIKGKVRPIKGQPLS